MQYDPITKDDVSSFSVKPNLTDYETLRKKFTWQMIYDELDWLNGGGLNIAHEAIDRHAQSERAEKIALYWEGKNGEEETYTFSDLKLHTNRFANVLVGQGIRKGDRVFTFLDRIPEAYFSIFGILKAGAIAGPLFSAFGPDAVKDRLQDSAARILITSPRLLKVVEQVRDSLKDLERIIVIDKRGRGGIEYSDTLLDYYHLIEHTSHEFDTVKTSKEDFSIMHYTSGTTGKPKGAAHVHHAVAGHYATAKYILDLHDDDIYWCTADPGWVTGTSYGMFGPWTNGVSQVVYEGGFSASHWYSLIEKYRVSVLYTAPTAVRMLMKAGADVAKKHNLSSLRYVCSVGEPLNPEAIFWGLDAFKMPIHDNWWQTETGCIQIANYPVQDIKPGSMGKPFLGTVAAIVDENIEKELPPGEEGHLVLKPGWPSMFQTYWNKEDLYKSRFKNGWYITGDKARMDEDGYFWFVGRSNDIINTAGHLVGPFEVESALIEHPAIAEAGVIGVPDEIAGEVIKAFVSLKDGYSLTDELRKDIKKFARKKLSSAQCPREIDFLDSLPKTRSGKIMRRLLKARELGLPEGDTSTLED